MERILDGIIVIAGGEQMQAGLDNEGQLHLRAVCLFTYNHVESNTIWCSDYTIRQVDKLTCIPATHEVIEAQNYPIGKVASPKLALPRRAAYLNSLTMSLNRMSAKDQSLL